MIQLSKNQLGKPRIVIRDSRGTLIEEGLRVAYNYQGSVAIGTIKSYKSDWKISRSGDNWCWWYCAFELKVLNENGFISTVKNPNSFIII